jgi:hypothetical protein
MGVTQSVLDIAGEWFLGAVKADSVQIGAGGAFTVDNSTSPPTVTANGSPLKSDYWYAVTPAGVIAPLATNAAVAFTTVVASAANTTITAPTTSRISLGAVGLYELSWQASITGAAQMGLYLVSGATSDPVAAGNLIPRTIVGRALANSQLTSTNLIEVFTAPVVLELRNVTGVNITFTEDAGGLNDVVVSMSVNRTY